MNNFGKDGAETHLKPLTNSNITGEQAEVLAASIQPLPLKMEWPYHAESQDPFVLISRAPGGGGRINAFSYKIIGHGELSFAVRKSFRSDDTAIFEVETYTYRGSTMFLKDRSFLSDALILSTFRSYLIKSFLLDNDEEIRGLSSEDRDSIITVKFVDRL